jgi:hypothetical protein
MVLFGGELPSGYPLFVGSQTSCRENTLVTVYKQVAWKNPLLKNTLALSPGLELFYEKLWSFRFISPPALAWQTHVVTEVCLMYVYFQCAQYILA